MALLLLLQFLLGSAGSLISVDFEVETEVEQQLTIILLLLFWLLPLLLLVLALPLVLNLTCPSSPNFSSVHPQYGCHGSVALNGFEASILKQLEVSSSCSSFLLKAPA